ncbi:uncharacterized protein LOC122498150 [Leptopilina heterotoma]|uniref:uncharacterized protein LOC122498150 n=1 Tax=Leptopilina heterotoma TaxID=63436 RepID=UPI001CA9A37D|nr:uncharacterized protein LOC122498150 [Leptopilina heterotoma]
MRLLAVIVVLCLLSLDEKVSAGVIWNFIHDLVQWNLAGIPKVHEKSTWNLDPKLGEERRAKFVKENGYLAEDLIERIGKGDVVESKKR